MNAGIDHLLRKAYFISPIVDMEKLITDMIQWANITEAELKHKGTIHTAFGEDLSWEYLSYVRNHPIDWMVPTKILYGSRDNLTSLETISDFAEKHSATLTVMEGGEHWFHAEAQMRFFGRLDLERKTAIERSENHMKLEQIETERLILDSIRESDKED